MYVFAREDQTSETLQKAAEKLDFEVNMAATFQHALDSYLTMWHDLIVIDARSSKYFDVETLCRFDLRNPSS